MFFVFYFSLLSAGLVYLAWQHGSWLWLLLWPALSCLLVALAYALATPRPFGKQSDGRLAWWAILLLFPYLAFSWILWHAVGQWHRLHSSEPYASQITPNLWLSRRILASEIPPGVTCIVDLTCEFPAARGLRRAVDRYYSLPTLDYGIPDTAASLALFHELRATTGGILMHCAQGHGRSALLAAAWLFACGAAKNDEEALRLLKQSRPNVRLTPRQHAALKHLINCLSPSQNTA